MVKNNLRKQALFTSIVLFAASLTQDCYCTKTSCVGSLQLFLTGWIALYMGGPMLVWLANPMLLIAWLTSKNSPYASLLSNLLAAGTATAFLFFKTIYNYDEAGITSEIINYKTGYWLWLASSNILLTGNITTALNKYNYSYKQNIVHTANPPQQGN